MTKTDPLGIGVMVRFGTPPVESFQKMKQLGLRHCQLVAPPDDYLYGAVGRSNTERLRDLLEEYNISVTSLFISFPDQDWNDWKNSIGLVPPHTRAERMARACRSADWAAALGIDQIACHIGYLRILETAEEYDAFVRAMRGLCRLVEANDQFFAYETGQESAESFGKLLDRIGVDNQRLNFDPANLLIYDEDDPMKMVDKFGDRIVHIHCKDAVRPQRPGELGHEVRLGDGATRFSALFERLCDNGYRGPLTIEREIPSGATRDADILHAVALLEKLRQPYLEKQ